MKKIKLTQEAYLRGGRVQVGICALDEWYEAGAEDGDGNEYRVIWMIENNGGDEDVSCNWDEPWAVIDDYGNDISGEVEIDA